MKYYISYSQNTEDSIANGSNSDYGLVYITSPDSAPHLDSVMNNKDGKDLDFYYIEDAEGNINNILEYIRNMAIKTIWYPTHKSEYNETITIDVNPDINFTDDTETYYRITLVNYTYDELNELKKALR